MSRDAKHEIMYIIRPSIDEEVKTALMKRFDTILKGNGAEVIESKGWEKRHLVYGINGFHEGIYHVVGITSPSTAGAIDELDRLARINDGIIRHMIVKVEA